MPRSERARWARSVRRAAIDQTALYEEDIYAWSRHQAPVLRGLAGTGLPLPDDLDLKNVAEEIESVGNGQRFAAEDGLLQALVRLIKVVALPGDQSVRYRTKEAGAFFHNAARRYRPSMRDDFDHGKLWSDAVRLAAADLRDDGHAVPPLPAQRPFGLEEFVGGEADPRELAHRLSAAAAGPVSGAA